MTAARLDTTDPKVTNPKITAPKATAPKATAPAVLLLGDDTRSFLTIARSLGHQGIAVHAAPQDFAAPALASRHIVRQHRLPPWLGDGADWTDAMHRLLAAERFDLVIPCDETGLLPLQAGRATLARLARLAIPSDPAIAALFDRHATRALAAELGIPVAPGRPLTQADTAAGIAREFALPVAVKPRRSYRLDQLDRRGRVSLADSESALALAMRDVGPDSHIVEAVLPGHGVGVSVLAHGGRLLQAFEHHRVREGPSGSYYRVSAPLTPALFDAADALLGALDYTGLAMLEFRVDPDRRRWALLEVNARPWGSLPLPVALGVDFPARWYRLLVHGEETQSVPYRAGVFGRNLLPDLEAGLAALPTRLRHPARLAGGITRELARLLSGRERQDVFAITDPAPAWHEATQLLGRVVRRLPSPARMVRARRAAAGARAVLFLCQGNICRSPFAAAALRRALPPDSPISVASAGLLPRAPRPVTEAGRQAAAAHGIDLTDHLSHAATDADIAAADLVVIFDETNRAALRRRHPKPGCPVIRLASFTDDASDIADPFGAPDALYHATYDRIAAAVTRLAVALVHR
jgi:protein-tyrosine-phosphatase/predicted ATP-grasp superfamily ATP-dependent carboligase